MNYLPTCPSRLVVQHPCQVSFKSMQVCRRSWEDKLKCVKILSVKGHNSAKICRTWIISPHALLDLWYNICTKFHWNPCKDVGGVEKTIFDATEWRKAGMTEWRTKQTLNAPLPFYGRGIKKVTDNVKVFSKVGQRSRSRSQVQNLWYRWKGFVIRITHAKYERLISKGKKSYGQC